MKCMGKTTSRRVVETIQRLYSKVGKSKRCIRYPNNKPICKPETSTTSVADYSPTVKTRTYAHVKLPFSYPGSANVDAYNTGYWSKVNSIEVCLGWCR